MNDDTIDLRAMVGLLRRRIGLILTTVVIVLAAVALALFLISPTYTGTATLLVEPRQNLLNPNQEQINVQSVSARVDSEVELVRSPTTLMRVLQEESLISDTEFGVQLGVRRQLLALLRLDDGRLPSGAEAVGAVLRNFGEAVSVRRVGLTHLIAVSVASEDPAKSARLANAIARAHIRGQLEAKIESSLEARDVLQAQIAAASNAIVQAEGQFDNFITQNLQAIIDATGRTDIADLRESIIQTDAQRAFSLQRADFIAQQIETRDWSSLATALQSEAIRELDRQQRALTEQIATLPEASTEAVDLRAELAAVEAQLATSANAQLTGLRQDVTNAQLRVSDLRQEIRSTVLTADLPTDILTRIFEIQQGSEVARGQYQNLLARLADVEAQASLQLPDARIVSEALPPTSPSFPSTMLFLALGGIAALGLGVGLAVLKEHFVGGFTTADQVEGVLDLPVVSVLPRQKPSGRGAVDGHASIADVLVTTPLSAYGEAVRRIRAAVDQLLRRTGMPGSPNALGKVIMVTSSGPDDGKTTVSLSLARAHAQTGMRVLLIDCDLRKPSLHRHLGLEPSGRLTDALSRSEGPSADLADLVETDPETPLHILVGARASNVPTDQLIAGPAFADLLSQARDAFDLVILDTPPIGAVVDGVYLANHADIIVMVLRWAQTSQRQARAMVRLLDRARPEATEMIAVLNGASGADMPDSARYARYYVGA